MIFWNGSRLFSIGAKKERYGLTGWIIPVMTIGRESSLRLRWPVIFWHLLIVFLLQSSCCRSRFIKNERDILLMHLGSLI